MMSELLQFAYEFFKTGLFAVGGGLATLPFFMPWERRPGGLQAVMWRI
jgi:chromate transport protein ChrA